jgi:hypothetical protein
MSDIAGPLPNRGSNESLSVQERDQLEARGMDVEIARKSAVVYGSISTKGEDRKLQSAV